MFVSIFDQEFGPIDLEQTSVDWLAFTVDLNLDANSVLFIGDIVAVPAGVFKGGKQL